jgi:glycosyltransferase involved in cell wall biosynthesis
MMLARRRGAAYLGSGSPMTDGPTPRFSLIIPAFNEERYLPRLLDSVDEARRRFSPDPDAVEVVVADNASSDGTAALALARGCRVVRVEKRAIAAARNAGAGAARGDILGFVDADTVRIDPRTFAAIEACLAGGGVVAGATGLRMERWSAGIALTYALILPFVWLTRMDSGVVFCRRDDFARVGGYEESRLYAEDVAFLLALRRLGRSRGQRLRRLRQVKAVGSVRKFDQHGDWHYLTLFPRLALAHLRGDAAAERLARDYWYRPGR